MRSGDIWRIITPQEPRVNVGSKNESGVLIWPAPSLSLALDLIFFTELNMVMAITVKDVDSIENRFREIFITKEEFAAYRSELMDKLDGILKEILASREEMTVFTYQVSNHEDRIVKLETKTGISPA